MQLTKFETFSAASAVDAKGLVKGVSVITGGLEAKGHGVFVDGKTLQTVQEVAAKFKQIKVKMNHGSGVDKIVGFITGTRIEGDRVRGDLQLIPSHPSFGFLSDLIATQPSTFGLSISFSWYGEKIDKKEFVRVVDILSIDLVDSPAANPSGLFSGGTPKGPKTFEEAVARFVTSEHLTKGAATEKAVYSHPALYSEWRNSGRTAKLDLRPVGAFSNFQALVAGQISCGKPKAEAVRFCVQNFPVQYAEWLTGGNTAVL